MKQYLLLICLFFLGLSSLFGQQKNSADSLIIQLKESKPDTAKVRLLIELSQVLAYEDSRASARYANGALLLSKKLHFDKGVIDANNLMALSYETQKRYSGALQYYIHNLRLYKNSSDNFGQASTHLQIGDVYSLKEEYSAAKVNYLEGLATVRNSRNKHFIASIYNKIAFVIFKEKDYKNSLLYYNQALKSNPRLNEEKIITYSGIGQTYLAKGDANEGLRYLKEGLKIAKRISDYGELEKMYLAISEAYEAEGNHKLALQYHKSHIQERDSLLKIFNEKNIAKLTGDFEKQRREQEIDILYQENLLRNEELTKERWIRNFGVSGTVILVILLVILFANNQKGRRFNKILIKQKKEIENQKEEIHAQYHNIDKQKKGIERTYRDIKTLTQLGKYINSSLEFDTILQTIYQGINQIMFAESFGIGMIDKKENAIFFKNFIEQGTPIPLTKISLSQESRLPVWVIKNRKEVFINDYEAEIANYTNNDLGAIVGKTPESVMYIPLLHDNEITGVVTVQSFRKNAFSKNHLDMFKGLATYIATAIDKSVAYHQIEEQREELTQKNNDVTASINYAKHIQTALLPKLRDIQAKIPKSFIFFKPRDIVSGDFYWFDVKDDKIYIAAVDCTGHGVPGAFMSMIGLEQLTEILNINNITQPSRILDELHKSVNRILRQDDDAEDVVFSGADGMDMAICMIDTKNNILEYAGAMNPLIYFKNNELHQIKGNKFAIGGGFYEKQKAFTNHQISLKDIDAFYIYSDGYQDQFGGERGKKFMTTKYKELLTEIHQKSMPEQQRILGTTLNNWMTNNGKTTNEQVDDILIIGMQC